ncbi:MAG: type II toxin-antitoxin system RelE/ParE family toxin [Bacteroidota bacterium]
MAYKIYLGKKAKEEYEEAMLWYHEASPQAAVKFKANILATLHEMSLRPHKYGPVRHRPRYRRAIVNRFPYQIVFRLEENTQRIFVLSFWHTRRNPAVLMKRLRH